MHLLNLYACIKDYLILVDKIVHNNKQSSIQKGSTCTCKIYKTVSRNKLFIIVFSLTKTKTETKKGRWLYWIIE